MYYESFYGHLWTLQGLIISHSEDEFGWVFNHTLITGSDEWKTTQSPYSPLHVLPVLLVLLHLLSFCVHAQTAVHQEMRLTLERQTRVMWDIWYDREMVRANMLHLPVFSALLPGQSGATEPVASWCWTGTQNKGAVCRNPTMRFRFPERVRAAVSEKWIMIIVGVYNNHKNRINKTHCDTQFHHDYRILTLNSSLCRTSIWLISYWQKHQS